MQELKFITRFPPTEQIQNKNISVVLHRSLPLALTHLFEQFNFACTRDINIYVYIHLVMNIRIMCTYSRLVIIAIAIILSVPKSILYCHIEESKCSLKALEIKSHRFLSTESQCYYNWIPYRAATTHTKKSGEKKHLEILSTGRRRITNVFEFQERCSVLNHPKSYITKDFWSLFYAFLIGSIHSLYSHFFMYMKLLFLKSSLPTIDIYNKN